MLLRQISIDQSRSPASGLCFSSSSPFARFVLPTKRNCEFDFSKFWRKVFIPHSLDLISFASLHDFQCGLLLGLSLWWIKKLLRSVFGCFSHFLIESVEGEVFVSERKLDHLGSYEQQNWMIQPKSLWELTNIYQKTVWHGMKSVIELFILSFVKFIDSIQGGRRFQSENVVHSCHWALFSADWGVVTNWCRSAVEIQQTAVEILLTAGAKQASVTISWPSG